MKKVLTLFIVISLLPAALHAALDSRTLFEQGVEAFNSGNYGSSELLFKKILDNDDEYRDRAWFYLARSIYQQKKYKSALYEFNSFLNKSSTSALSTEARYWLGESYFNLDSNIKAIEEYKRYISNTTDGRLVSSAHNRIGTIYFSQERFDEAVIEWEKALSRSNDRKANEQIILKIGNALFRGGKYEESLKRLNPLLTSNADTRIKSMARLVAGKTWQNMNMHSKALLMLNGIPGDLLKEKPFYEAQYFKARSYISLGNNSRARLYLGLFIIIGKDSPWYYNALYELGRITINSTEADKGLEYLEQVRKSSKDPVLRVRAAKILSEKYMESNPEKAIPYLEASLTTKDTNEYRDLLLMLGRAYIEIKNYDRAEEYVELFLKKYPFDSSIDEAHFLRARIYLEKGDSSRARALFEQIQKENPFSRYINESGFYTALVYYREKNYSSAIGLLKKYLAKKNIKNRYNAYVILAGSYMESGSIKNAGAIVNLLIRNYLRERGTEVVIFNYARALDSKGMPARYYYDFLLRNFPDSETATAVSLVLGNYYFKKKNYAVAEKYYTMYLKGAGIADTGPAYYNRLVSLFQQKKYDTVISTIMEGNIPPMEEKHWKDLPRLLARSYFYLERFENVVKVMNDENLQAYEKDDLPIFITSLLKLDRAGRAEEVLPLLAGSCDLLSSALYEIGSYYDGHNAPDKAVLLLSRIISDCPASSYADSARILIARIHIRDSRFSEAVSILNKVTRKDLSAEKYSMLVSALFRLGRDQEALKLTVSNLALLLRSVHGESVMRLNCEYYYRENNITEFFKYARYLGRYRGNEALINYMSGKIYYSKGYYKKSYYYFYKLSLLDSVHRDESFYLLGRLGMFAYGNRNMAIKYYKKLVDQEHADRTLVLKSLIELSIIYNDMKLHNDSRTQLDRIFSMTDHGLIYFQAKNLYSHFGFSGQKSR